MLAVLSPRHFHIGAYHRLWLVLAALVAFLMAALWAQPIG